MQKFDLNQAATTLKAALKMSDIWGRFAVGKRTLWAEQSLSSKMVIELLAFVPLPVHQKTEFLRHLGVATKPGPAANLVRTNLLADCRV